jgi:DNA invertase Pin-like site-specific DNA recombinase
VKARIVLRESNETLKEGYGFPNQREDCLAFAATHDLEVVQEHQLVERSTVWNREKFQQVIDEAILQRAQVPAIVFPRVDRFARNLQAAGYFLGSLRLNSLVVMFAQEGLVVDKEATAMQVLMFFVHSFKADQDARQIARNTAGGRNKLAEIAHEVPNGMVIWCFDYLPKRIYGKQVSGKPAVNEGKAAWVRKWADWIVEEGIGVSEVCRRMNKNDTPPPRQSRNWNGAAREWQRSCIIDILRSRQLVGEFEWRGQVYLKEDSLRILSDERFEALQKRLDENRERSYYNAAKYDYPPLRKMVFCSCGHLMYGIPASGITYYRCPECKREWVNAQRLWGSIQREIKDALLSEERIIPAIRKQFDSRETIERLEQEIKAKTHGIAEWQEAKDKAFRMGMVLRNYSPERVQKEIDSAEGKIQTLKAEKADVERRLTTVRQRILNEEGIRRFCQLAANNLDNLSKDQWEMLLRLMKLQVTVHSKYDIKVSVALPPVKDAAEIELSRL